MVVAVAVPEMADDGLEDRAVEGGRSGIGRGVRLAARGTAVCSSEATGIFFSLGSWTSGPVLFVSCPFLAYDWGSLKIGGIDVGDAEREEAGVTQRVAQWDSSIV